MKRYRVSLAMLPTWMRHDPAGGFLTARMTWLSWAVCETVTVTSEKTDCSVIVRLFGSTRVNEGLPPLQPRPNSALETPEGTATVVSVADTGCAISPGPCAATEALASSISL